MIGIIVGVGLMKIYYEIFDIEKENVLVKKEIEEIVVKYENFKYGSELRKINFV